MVGLVWNLNGNIVYEEYYKFWICLMEIYGNNLVVLLRINDIDDNGLLLMFLDD